MGKLLTGINGPFTGKVGTVVGYMWRDIAVMRGPSYHRTKPFSPKELNQQAKFRLMNRFLLPAKDLLDKTFAHLAVRMTGYNKAFSYNVKACFRGFHPELILDYSMVLLSRGDLTKAESAVVTAPSPTELQFSWNDNSGTGKAINTDQVFVAVFNPVKNRWFYQMNVAVRSTGNFTLDFVMALRDPSPFSGQPLQAYIGFVSADGKDASDSVYLGTVEVRSMM